MTETQRAYRRPPGPARSTALGIDRETLVTLERLRREFGDMVSVSKPNGRLAYFVIPVQRIPKTTSGKVQRGELLEAYIDGEFDEILAQMGRVVTDVEGTGDDALVAELELICRELSKDRRIGPDDNLFEVGVSSLTLTEIVLAIDEKYPGKLDISDLFDYPTLRAIAAFLERNTK